MAFVVVEGAIIQCAHKGQAKLGPGNPKMTVGGHGVVTSGMEAGISFAPGSPAVLVPCSGFTPGAPPPPTFCLATQPTLPAGLTPKLIVDGKQALLDGASGTAGNPNDLSAKWSVLSVGQNLLTVS